MFSISGFYFLLASFLSIFSYFLIFMPLYYYILMPLFFILYCVLDKKDINILLFIFSIIFYILSIIIIRTYSTIFSYTFMFFSSIILNSLFAFRIEKLEKIINLKKKIYLSICIVNFLFISGYFLLLLNIIKRIVQK